MKRFYLLILLLCAAAHSLLAQDPPPPVQPVPPAPMLPAPPPPAVPFKNLKLSFQLLPQEPDDKEYFLMVTDGPYRTRLSMDNNQHAFWMDVSGSLRTLPDGKFMIAFNATLHFEGNDATGEFQAESTVLIEPGNDTAVTRMGDRTLIIRIDPAGKE